MKNKGKKWIINTVCLLLTAMLLVPFGVSAATIDPEKKVSVSISCVSGKETLVGLSLRMYLVATVDQDGTLTETEEFKDFDVNIQGKKDEAWRTLASTLEGYVLRDKMTAADEGTTDINGVVSFPSKGKELTQGLYLVVGDRHTQDGYYYDATPFMVLLPAVNGEENLWEYDVKVNGKFQSEKIPEDKETTTIKVLKVWDDKGYEKYRPDEVKVQLLKDGEIYDTVILNEKNNWRHTWTDLDANAKWNMTEVKIRRYHVEIEKEGKTFVIENTYHTLWDEYMKEKENRQNGGSTLPQTGQLWWPVPLLFSIGILCMIVGVLRRRRFDHEG